MYRDIYVGPPPQNSAEALVIYHRVLAQAWGQLPFRGVDVSASDPGGAAATTGGIAIAGDVHGGVHTSGRGTQETEPEQNTSG